MLLVFCSNATSRVNYIFRHVFHHCLGIKFKVTNALDEFIAHNGPKMSYGDKPLGNEFFIQATSLLFEQGIRETELGVEKWKSYYSLFPVSHPSKMSFDVFAASFYLLSRYEEYLPHLKDAHGRFISGQSVAAEHQFLQVPLVDYWIKELSNLLRSVFPDLPQLPVAKESFMPLVEVVSPFKYAQKSIFTNVIQWVRSLLQLNFWAVVEQPLVLLGMRTDPWETFDQYTRMFSKAQFKTRFFFLYSRESYQDRGISTNNIHFRERIKAVADYFSVSLLGSYLAHQSSSELQREKEQLSTLIHRPVNSQRFAWGVTTVSEAYRHLIAQEIENDFSLGYPNTMGYRASTAVPFLYYDLTLEMETQLLLYPVVASANVIAQYAPNQLNDSLKKLFQNMPLPAGIHCIAFRNAMFEDSLDNQAFREALISYLRSYD